MFGDGALNLNPIPPPNQTGVDAIATKLDSQITQCDSQVGGYGIPVVVPNDMVSHSISFALTRSQQYVEGTEASRTSVDSFIDGEYAGGLDDESEVLRGGPSGTPAVDDPTPLALNRKAREYMLDQGLLGRLGMHRYV